METKWLTEKEAADYLGRSVITLQQWRWRANYGPKYYRDPKGGIRYLAADLDEWIISGTTQGGAEPCSD